MLFNAGFSIAGLSEKDLSNSKCENLGRVIGDLISLLGGGTEMAAGVGGEGIGLGLDAIPGGAIAGVLINIASGAVVLGGGIVLKRSAGNLYAVDSQHGRFEMLNAKGKHKGEVNFDFEQTKPADNSGGHNLKMK
jgi:hypothetical protein